MDAATALTAIAAPVATRERLLLAGATPRDITAAVRCERIVRVRCGFYALPDADAMAVQAVRVGGRLACVSAADRHGVWVPQHASPHIALRHEASRLRHPLDRSSAFTRERAAGCELHWWPLPSGPRGDEPVVDTLDALVHIVRCQPRDVAVAALDSALHEGVIGQADLDGIFAAVPAKYAYLRRLLDARCASGIESIVRLVLVDAGLAFEPQVRFAGIGTVDFVVAGCLVIETDGRAWHDGGAAQSRDYDRDLALIARGYAVLRLNYRQVMHARASVLPAILAALRAHRGGPAV